MKAFLVSTLLLVSGMAQAQILVEGSVFGGGNIGEVDGSTTVTVNGGTVGKKIPLIDRTIDQNLQLHSRVEYGNVYGGGNGYDKSITIESNVVPGFNRRAGLVKGNTTVLIRGNAVVRRAVYGGGNMASVGDYTEGGVYTPAEGKGQTKVTITGNALIGPKMEDLTQDDEGNSLSRAEIDTAFRYLGSNEGWVFGSSRGLAGDALKEFSFVDTTAVIINGNAQALNVFGSGENGHVKRGTFVNIAGNAIIGGVPLHNTDYPISSGTYSGVTVHLYGSDGELVEDEFGVGRLVTRGNVLGGGKGSDFIPWLTNHQYSYSAGRVYGSATVRVEGNAQIYNRVFGGGLLASVGTFTEDASHAISGIEGKTGNIFLTIEGGTIGSPGSNGLNNGEVYGGGRGIPGRRVGEGGTIDPLHQALDLAYVGHTHVTVDGGTILNNVYGGAANGHVQGDSHVTLKETNSSKPTTIGLATIGGWHGNVFAGGGGTTRYKDNNTLNLSITAGRVFGDTYLEMTGGHVLHNVYGGGAIASVGTYDASEVVNPTHPYLGHGHSKITITGGQVGTNGNNNGMVFGSGRGQIAAPGNFLDYVTYVAYSEVNIGTGSVNESTGQASNLSGNAKINGSVYGSGENGHTYLEAVVNVFGGTIGCTAAEYDAMSDNEKENLFPYRGNVYGAGCGTDKYDTNNDGVGDTYNPLAGVVQGNTKVNIYGGYISRTVYGAGAMASVGSFTIDEQHTNTNTSAALSWPYKLTYTTITDANNDPVTTGKTEVNIRGGHIGTLAAPIAECGNVFGSARGDVGPLGTLETMSIVRETEVNVNFAPPTGEITNATPNVIIGSVYGSGENGTVYENTKVTLTNGLIGGSVFGGGDGTDTYTTQLKDPDDDHLYDATVRSITSGKVYGNTEIVINGGTVQHNVYGGGNLASVGKGSYMGYGELTSEDPTEDPYEDSGICTVTVTGGTIGTTGYPGDGYNNGFVFGSSKGTVFKTINLNPRYDYSRDFFLGYVNKTIVNIGDPDVSTAPVIKGAVFGGGDNGHVRWHTDVTVNKGEIGEAYVVPATYPEADSIIKWAYRGNVYGAGRGADMYDSDGDGRLDSYCPSAGSVTLNTNVTVNGGTIHRNVYGGGSMATVGPPPTGYDPGNSKCTVNIYGGTIGEVVSSGAAAGSLYGGNVYGAGRGIIDQLAPLTQYAAAVNTEVNVQIGNATDKVIGNVYGGGSYGQVKEETNVNMKAGHVKGSVFGGGMGFETEVIAGLVAGNATVDMTGGTIERSIYGGGQMGSVGTFLTYNDVTYNAGQSNAFTVQVPTACEANTGLTTVKMSGGNVGLLGSLMPWGDHNPDDDDRGWIFCGGQGLGDSITYPKAIAMGVVGSTYLEISNPTSGASPLVTASVYGGCENGLVLNNTHVKIAGGQIGTGHYKTGNVHHFDPMYDEDNDWAVAIAAVQSGDETAINNAAARFHECDAWEYGKVEGNETKYYVYDYYANDPTHPNNNSTNPDYHTASTEGSNGHSFFGNVFGGGSGFYPIAPGIWRRTAGQVNGDTYVEITGGHILTSVYGGNETTDVKGKCTIEMSGGTLGVPRTIAQIKGHPVTCYVFGAGMGDTRTQFNTWTMVDEVEVSITGGTIFGSVFGGGEDGHVLGDVDLTVGGDAWVGTWGRSYVDGNVFGGGRGFSGNALSAGVVMGNVDMTISGGTMLGSIYGGGRLASVGSRLVPPTDSQYGQLIPDSGDDTHGHVTINITGGTIGNDYEAIYHTDFNQHTTGGHVFAGAMGRLTNLDNSTNSLWPNLGKVKETVVTISGDNTLIKGNVYGGGEFGTVETDATITVSGGTIMRDVYGGGYGSTDITSIGQLRVPNGSSVTLVPMTPMKLAGRVNGNTEINIEGGWIQKSVYGGGEMATVGVINDSVPHTSEATQFALSWPYKMNYKANTGKTEINVTGGRIGITGSDYMGPYAMINGQLTPVQYNDQGTAIPLTETEIDDAKEDNGDVYGGGKGFAAQRYLEAHANNVHDTHVTVNYTSNSATPTNYKEKVNGVYTHDCIAGAVYGGGENGHVIQNTNITLTNGLVGHNIYGGGKGKGLYTATLNHYTVNPDGSVTEGDEYETDIYSITAGKVYGNTHVTMNGGYVVRNIYGGGNMASVGKGNYTGAPDDYSTTGYGECVTTTSAMADTLHSGNTFVTITGGQLGYLNPSNPDKVIKDGLPYGSVYGGCRGVVQRDVPRTLTPRILYSPEDFLGYVNKTHVVIGSATGSGTGPRLYGSVYGGGQDGHVRWNTNITFNKGEIGVDFGGSELIANDETIQNDYNSHHWANRGNVYGAGSGIGQYTDANNVKHYSYISGSVTQFTNVEIKGGTIHNNVYGGGNLATVGPPRILQSFDCPAEKTGVTVNIKGNAEIGKNTNQNSEYGGNVYGASRGIASEELGTDNKPKYKDFAYCSYTEVNVSESPVIYGAVFGGGENGKVGLYHEDRTSHVENGQNIHTSTVNITGGTIKHSVYGGGQGVFGDVIPGSSPVAYYVNDTMSGRVMGNATVNLMGGTVGYFGSDGIPAGQVFGGARRALTWGNTTVNVGSMTNRTEVYDGDVTIIGSVYGANNYNGTPNGNVTVNVYKTHHDPETDNVLGNWYPADPHADTPETPEELVALSHEIGNFAIYRVFGGSNQTDYLPRTGKEATVHVYQCEENTIYQVFGGSDAANIGSSTNNINANVIIDGGRMHQVFGGGNGIDADHAANIYGTATTKIDGGLIDELFGGSNNYGNINGINLIVSDNPVCDLIIGNGYGGGNDAPYVGDIVAEILCGESDYENFYGGASHSVIYGNVTLNVSGGTITNLFGGSKGRAPGTNSTDDPGREANIRKYPSVEDIIEHHDDGTYPPALIALYDSNHETYANNYEGTGGNVTVNLYGGTLTNVFGGSDANGNIEGVITVNVLDVEGNCPLKIANIYGASNNACYTPDDIVVEEVQQKPVSPVINVVHIKDDDGISKNVFGAGKGNTATTTSNPLVNIGYNHAAMAKYIPLDANGDSIYHVQGRTPRAFVTGNVYGGGEEGTVVGSTTVNVNKSNTIVSGFLYGGGEGNNTNVDYAKINGSTTVRINDGLIKKSVFGGGEMAIITGNTDVKVSGGTVGSWMYETYLHGSVYGGGQGATYDVDEHGNLIDNSDSENFGRVMGNTYVEISGNAHILKDVYGGGQMGSVGNGILNDKTTGVAHVTIRGGQIGPFYDDEKNANVYGGGQGRVWTVPSLDPAIYTNHANVDSTSVIITDAASIEGSVFGGSSNGHVLGGTYVQVTKGTNTPTIGKTGLSGEDGHVYGGGQGIAGSFTAGRVGGITKVEISDGNILGCVFGGGRMALTGVDVNGSFDTYVDNNNVYDTIHHGTTHVEITGGVIGNPSNNGSALLTSDQVSGNVYGAGRGDPNEHKENDWGRVAKSVLSISGSPTIYGSVFGGGQMANVGHWLDYTGLYAKGTSTTTVNITGSPTIGTEREFSQAYASTNPTKTLYETINGRKMLVHTRTGNVYGSGQGDVKLRPLGKPWDGHPEGFEQGHCGKTFVNISGTPTIMGSVFGGAEQGAVWYDTRVNISGGTIGTTANTDDDTGETPNLANNYAFGSVFGGSYGKDAYLHLGLPNALTEYGVPTDSIPYLVDSINGLTGRVYGNTYVIITGGTIRENVYGGGDMASVGEVKDDGTLVNGKCNVNISKTAIVGPLDGTGLNGYVYGGGKGIGNDPDNLRKKYCNVHDTEVTVNLTFANPYDANGISRPDNWNVATDGRVYGSLFGGGADGHTLRDTKVNLQGGLIGTEGTTSWDGNIFGGGRNFRLVNYTAGRVGGNVTVEMTGGHLLGSLFGGGRNAITGLGEDVVVDPSTHTIQTLQDGDSHGKITVMVKGGTVGNNTLTNNSAEPTETFVETFSTYSMGSVYGGGKGTANGISGHTPASALLISMVKDTDVQISQANVNVPTHIYGIVFGGGEMASVGNCTWKQSESEITDIDMKEGTGLAKVTISGGIIGADRAKMRYEAGDAPYQMYPKYNDDLGYVYGGGEGLSDNPTSSSYPVVSTARFGSLRLLDIMASVNKTEVEISGGWVKASVFGGAECGHVMGDTKVTISGGQIGAGDNKDDDEDVLYTDGTNGTTNQFVNPVETTITAGNSLKGTYHWDFISPYNPYDPAEIANDPDHYKPTDGKSWFGNVFGGGSGWFPYITNEGTDLAPNYVSHWNSNSGKVWGNTEVIITGGHILNNVYGANEATDVVGTATITMSGGTVGVPRTDAQIKNMPVMGYLFGGGCGDPRAIADGLNNVGNTNVTITGGIIYGSALGGAEDGHVLGDAKLTVQEPDPENHPTVIGTSGNTGVDGNLFGGGRNFLRLTYAAGRVGGNTTVNMTGGKVLGCIYGGGRNALVGFNGNVISTGENTYQVLPDNTSGHTNVKVSGGTVGNLAHMRDSEYPIGDVFGAGKGSKEGIVGHPLPSTLLVSLVKDTEVEISGTARIYGSVYGGGEISNVGNYTWKQTESAVSNIGYKENTGHTKVAVKGGTIGMDNMQMITDSGYPDDWGHVFGGCEGWVEKLTDSPVIDEEGDRLVELMASVGTTEVTIKDNAFVLGSVYGGADNGHVLDSTYVAIKGGQIGAGYQVFNEGTQTNRPYTSEEWNYAQHQSLPECASWTFGGDYAPYDINILNPETHKPKPGKNGTTFYGNVFGGGSGYYPYGVDESGHSQWLRTAGQVRGNTRVEVSGGHILTSLYGGCETTDVLGDSTSVIMTGGTLGVPRTLAEIAAHPVTCYVFGGGKGIADSYFNTWTNVQNAHVNIKGGWIYGSVFGGGEDGHVKNNVIVDVAGTIGTNEQAMAGEATKIGTWGTSYVDGNIFGGGRGFAGDQITAGAVGGNINVNIKGGAMLGSIYGGGRMASTGINYTDPTNPGQFSEDGEGKTYGYINVDISGGTIGNEHEYVYANPSATLAQMATWQAAHHMPYTEFDANNNNHLSRTKGGNVFGGPMGRLTKMDGTTINPFWPSLGKAKQTTVVVRGTAVVKSSVYGGGEFGTVRDNATVRIQGGTVGTRIANPDYDPENPGDAEEQYHYGSVYGGGFGSRDLEYTGTYANDSTANGLYKRPVEIAGRVYGNTFVYIEGGQVLENVFGGGELASIGMVKNGAMFNGVATVEMTGGQVGPLDMTGLNAYVYGGSEGIPDHGYKAYCNVNSTSLTVDMDLYDDEHDTGDRVWGSLFGGGSDGHVLGDALVLMRQGTLGTTGVTSWDGNIFGGGRNYSAVSETSGRVGGNVEVTVTGGHLLGSVFGGGRLGSVGIDEDGVMQEDAGANTYGYTTVNIGSDDDQNEIIIGHLIYDEPHPDERVGGNVYGGGKGIAGPSTSIYPNLAKVKRTEVNIKEQSGKETWIEGSVFGGGEDGHVLQDTYVNIYNGQIGGKSFNSLEPCASVYHGNVYGGGRGVDTYEHEGEQIHSHTAGWVQGNTNVNMVGGHVVRNVYGGGNLASVGIADEPDPEPGQDYRTGLASVTITGGTVGKIHENENFGNVFGSGHGGVGGEYVDLAFVKNTHVTIGQTAQIYGSVFGGGEDGHVRKNALVDIEGGTIGDADGANPTSTYYNPLDGNVYGGGRGLLTTVESETAGEVYGYTIVNIRKSTGSTEYSPVIWNNVYGGGSQSVVHDYKVVNMSGGLIHGSLFGGSRQIPASRPNKAPRWVNMWGGTVEGNVYGCSYYAEDGDPANDEDWASFVNISGGTIGTDAKGGIEKGNVYGAGYGGKVKGSVAVLIGQNAIVETSNDSGDEFYGKNIHRQETPAVANLDIKGSVFGGSYGSIGSTDWDHSFNVSGYSRVYIDGTDYNTTISAPAQSTTNYMNIEGGIYGCGTNCESGVKGRNILVRNYGTRNPGGRATAELTQASRTLTTLQRGDIILLDNTNVNLSGADDISQSDSERKFAVLQVDKGVYVTNASGIVLGASSAPVYMDSIHEVRSLHLRNASTSTSYGHLDGSDANYWEWIGVNPNGGNTEENARLYYTQTAPSTPLSFDQENVIIFNGDSRLYVRYLDKTGGNKKRMYGQLQGFFRMRGDFFQPVGTESFAYARPKVTLKNNPISVTGHSIPGDIMNGSDGGFLSYNTDYNYFTSLQTVLYYTYTTDGDDGGSNFTKTKQYPYFNIGEYVQNRESGEMDLEEFREWVLPRITGKIWYVDGRGIGNGGWGKDASHQAGWGHFPDMPKLTVSGNTDHNGICKDQTPGDVHEPFNFADDIIYVVGPVEAIKEDVDGLLNQQTNYTLKLYRYPGGHMMSNGKIDNTVVDASHPAPVPSSTYDGLVNEGSSSTMDATKGPGANLGMMINANSNLVMDNVLVDGLYDPSQSDVTTHNIPTSFTSTQMYKVDKPMVVTTEDNTLTLKGYKNTLNEEIVANGTILQRGYNNTDAASTWYSNADYDCYSGSTVALEGGGLFVDKDATVNVEGLVTITGSKQRRLVGSVDHPVNSNVYLPTFFKHLNITDELNEKTRIGVTSPIRNKDASYHNNTLSPVAKAVPVITATMTANEIAAKAWENCNFTDDQGWFFVSGNKTLEPASPRTTYYVASGTKDRDNKTLYFGWTWASVVRTAPTGYSATSIDSPEDLAWLITKDKFQNESFKQTADLDMKQYVWVPIGNEVTPFIGNYDGQGHLIKNLYIDYIGTGDLRYELTDYGLFGHVHGGTVDRTFVVSGRYQPVVSDLNGTAGKNIGGLVGSMDGTSKVSNSEAAVTIVSPNLDDGVRGNAIGGLVANLIGGEIHSSMTMSTLSIGQNYQGTLGGLVGKAMGGAINNSFANVTFEVSSNSSVKAGGLIGENTAASMRNCYVTWIDGNTTLLSTNFGRLMASNASTNTNNVQYCYARKNTTVNFGYTVSGSVDTETCKQYTPVIGADNLGYMYADNKVEGDTAMFMTMNRWVTNANNSTPRKYARWARPGLAYYETVGENQVLRTPINGDLPVLLLSDLSSADVESTDDFRSLATYGKGKVLQYGGTARDGSDKHLSTMLGRDEYVFVYGDVDGHDESGFDGDDALASVAIEADKVSIYEHASIKYPGNLAGLGETYVGITFDNSFGHATSTPGINEGLNGLGIGPYPLPRDWHMFSSPLSNAPLGFNYGEDNDPEGPCNNPWESPGNEFNWLNGGQPNGNNRYWMKNYDVADGYFPTGLDESVIPQTDDLFIVNSPATPSDECPASGVYRYPYGMDFYTWNEPQYHWINFKRNGPNHWHSDTPHVKLDYVTEVATNHASAETNINESVLISGKGYMAAITKATFMQSHGLLNSDENKIMLSNSGYKMPGWNLVGNPFHGYLDFELVAQGNGGENGVLSDQSFENLDGNRMFYVVYNADKYQNHDASTAFRYYPVRGSRGGDYAERFLHPHQGFYVKAKKAGDLTLNESMLVPRSEIEGGSTFRDDRPAYPLVNLYLSSDQGCADVTVIEFERPEWGGATKLKELRVGDGLFYAQHDNTHYAALFAQQGIDRVPVWFEAKEDDIFTLKWNTANADFHSMYLIDHITGIEYDMLRNDTYTFEGHKGDYPSRFLIVFSLTDVEEHNEIQTFVFFDGSQWIVTGDGQLDFVDPLGQVLMSKEVHGGQSRVGVPDVAPGVYLFRLTNSEGTRVQKVIVKR